jgi:hypothetical protein
MRSAFHFSAFVTIILFFSACSSLPDHAKLIPGDAIVVAGVNTEEIGKKMAWNAILGSKLFDEWKKQQATGKEMETDPAQMGVELMSTSYVYVKTDKRFNNGSRITALIPLDDAVKWESFVKKNFPEAVITKQKDHSDAALADGMYVGWTNDLLIVMNTLEESHEMDWANMDDTTVKPVPVPVDNTQLVAEMNNAFHLDKKNAITENKKFTALEKNGHDITVWINYDVLMSQYGSQGLTGMMGISLSNALWKDAALTAGFDFEKGKIAGDFHYYMSEEMKETGVELGKEKIDKEMVDRLPKEKLDMLMTWHLSPKGVKGLLEKMGVLGFINLALSGEDLSADYILEAFTGDMVVALNNFHLEQTTDTTIADTVNPGSYSPNINYIYALKINKKANFDRLFGFFTKNGVLQVQTVNHYLLGTGASTVHIIADGKYCIVSDNQSVATNYSTGKSKGGKLPVNAAELPNNPFGMYFNAQGVMNTVSPGLGHSVSDSAMIEQSKRLLQDVVFYGGSFKNNAFDYKMTINFLNKEENSLLQLIDFAMKMDKAKQEATMVTL